MLHTTLVATCIVDRSLVSSLDCCPVSYWSLIDPSMVTYMICTTCCQANQHICEAVLLQLVEWSQTEQRMCTSCNASGSTLDILINSRVYDLLYQSHWWSGPRIESAPSFASVQWQAQILIMQYPWYCLLQQELHNKQECIVNVSQNRCHQSFSMRLWANEKHLAWWIPRAEMWHCVCNKQAAKFELFFCNNCRDLCIASRLLHVLEYCTCIDPFGGESSFYHAHVSISTCQHPESNEVNNVHLARVHQPFIGIHVSYSI